MNWPWVDVLDDMKRETDANDSHKLYSMFLRKNISQSHWYSLQACDAGNGDRYCMMTR